MKPNIESNQSAPKNDQFSQTGFILAAIGSAVGLGNMWKFPYITGKYGGAAFFLLFIICLIAVGLPVLLAEMTVGRGGRGTASTAFYRLSGKISWSRFGLLSVIGAFMIMSFYAVVAGWTLHYAMLSFSGKLFDSADYKQLFVGFAGGYTPLFWQAVVFVLCIFVLLKGVSAGIERFNKILIPGLVILLFILMGRALSLPGAMEGVKFFLQPDFSKLSAESALVALGHAFFSLSLGMGTMIIYGSYVNKKQSLTTAAAAVCGGDLLYALLAGLIIFPTIFAYGIAPSEGPGLVFMALPAAFEAMPFGEIFGGLFFVLLAIAALTSAISLVEVPVAYSMENWGWSRNKGVWIINIICFVIGVPAALSVGGPMDWTLFGKTYFDLLDYAASNILLPLGGLTVSLFVGYVWKKAGDEAGISSFWYKVWIFQLRYVAPIVMLLVLLNLVGVI